MESKTNLEKVKEFHEKFNVPVGVEFENKLITLRASLIDEEYNEVINELYPYNTFDIDKKLLAKELADLLYVTYGTAITFGIPLDEVFAEVHRSNMTKSLDAKRADGKILKGDNYEAPNLEQFFGDK